MTLITRILNTNFSHNSTSPNKRWNWIPKFSLLFNLDTYCLVPDEIWNAVTKRCERLVCDDGSVLSNKRCNIHTKALRPVTSLKECPKIILPDGIILQNGSVYSPLHAHVFSKDEYLVTDNSQVLVCFDDYPFSDTQPWVTLAVFVVSLVFLVLHFAFYCCFARLRTWHGRNLLCLCCALFLAQTLFLVGPQGTGHIHVCLFLSVSLHYFWLASFFWMNVLSLDIWGTFTSNRYIPQKRERTFLFYNLYSWGVPALIVIIALLMDNLGGPPKLSPRYGSGFKWRRLCWIDSKLGLVYFFLLPVGVIILENVILFVLTSKSIYKQSQETKFANVKTESDRRENQSDAHQPDSETENRRQAIKVETFAFV